MNTLESYGKSLKKTGANRNEDYFIADDSKGIYIVCDGMGGGLRGDEASTFVSENLYQKLAHLQKRTKQSVKKVFLEVQELFLREFGVVSAVDVENKIGTTATVAVAQRISREKIRFICANVGDSRAYILQNNAETNTKLTKLTQDCVIPAPFWNIEQKICNLRAKYLQNTLDNIDSHDDVFQSQKIAKAFDFRFLVTNFYVNVLGKLYPDVFYCDINPKDILFLLTDGFSDNISSRQFQADATSFNNDILGVTVEELVTIAHSRSFDDHVRSKPDDITLIGVRGKE